MKVSVTVNGASHEHEVEPRLLLVYYLREVVKNADGSVSNKYIGKVADKLADAYVSDCKMP